MRSTLMKHIVHKEWEQNILFLQVKYPQTYVW